MGNEKSKKAIGNMRYIAYFFVVLPLARLYVVCCVPHRPAPIANSLFLNVLPPLQNRFRPRSGVRQ
jgi:hypothetical protein